ncbi:MAG: hypothetical protein ACK4FF_14410 [Limnobacter sp.]|uniref:hypothetical protein n=1 Tax=Limnobacter sp. TaxID=2003368 RepID=UPI00391C2958
MHNAYYSLIDEALNNHSRRCRFVGVEVPIQGDELPTGIKKVIVSVTNLLFVPTSQENKSTAMMLIQVPGGGVHDVWACAHAIPYLEYRSEPNDTRRFPVLIWDIGQLLGYQAKFEVPTLLFSGNLFMQNPEGTCQESFHEEIIVMATTEQLSISNSYTLGDILVPLNQRKALDGNNDDTDWSNGLDNSTAH